MWLFGAISQRPTLTHVIMTEIEKDGQKCANYNILVDLMWYVLQKPKKSERNKLPRVKKVLMKLS